MVGYCGVRVDGAYINVGTHHDCQSGPVRARATTAPLASWLGGRASRCMIFATERLKISCGSEVAPAAAAART